LLQNADDAGARNFTIDFQTHKCASNGIQPGLDSVQVRNMMKSSMEC
jgi:hypothetical protein